MSELETSNLFRKAVISSGDYARFIGKYFKTVFKPPYEWKQVLRHVDELGTYSTPLVLITNFLIGAILALQARPTMEDFGAAGFLPALVTRSLTIELSPVITALIVAGRVSSGIGAELGSMRVTEQIDAMECSGVDPYNYLVTTRITAMVILMPILTIMADFIGIFGSFVAEFIATGATLQLYYQKVQEYLLFWDVIPGIMKTALFGFAIALIGAYKGFNTESGTQGVGRATTSAVVLASLWILVIDLLVVKLLVTFRPDL
ncbi:MAG: MlaE family ABC transporter permease [Candidatus Kapaibacterium sp.]